ncbi:hypothetical protein EJ06DRAFT_6632 [Trichodelitschia bisporula]|uniref:Uncharacterized protein n=1 Tax=Trichodelitschia bisporula TaxID=703511 RepID=A0A6G1IA85_9PEZI|nr:hypothetical protein EJ06DRAFT_6632 [Trichodelitschia bisporula]
MQAREKKKLSAVSTALLRAYPWCVVQGRHGFPQKPDQDSSLSVTAIVQPHASCLRALSSMLWAPLAHASWRKSIEYQTILRQLP